MSLAVTWNGDEPTLSKPVESFQTGDLVSGFGRDPMFGGSFDGTRFLVARVTHRTPGTIDVLVNWTQALGQ
jgi:hypothetical protein